MQCRQGDVFIESASESWLPPDAQRRSREAGKIILAHGEATGHAHAIADRGAELYRSPLRDDGDAWLRVTAPGGVRLTHEEHAPILLPRGFYVVRRQREYSPESPWASRFVAD